MLVNGFKQWTACTRILYAEFPFLLPRAFATVENATSASCQVVMIEAQLRGGHQGD